MKLEETVLDINGLRNEGNEFRLYCKFNRGFIKGHFDISCYQSSYLVVT